MFSPSPLQICLLMPVRNDWASASILIQELDKAVPSWCTTDVIMVDDGSSQPLSRSDFSFGLVNIKSVNVLSLRRNVGHQRAISIGLLHIKENHPCDAVLVMDADGEDTAGGAAELIAHFSGLGATTAVFAERSRRSESHLFRFFYVLYKLAHRALTGLEVRVGNFSLLPFSYLSTLAVMPELWNHYAATVFRSRLLFRMIPIPRGRRIAGASQMNFVSLVTHGLSAIVVFGDVVGVRLLITAVAGSVLAALGIIAIVAIRMFTDRAIPGWATYSSSALAIIGMQLLSMAMTFTFFILSTRSNLGFVPIRDYSLFVADCVRLAGNE